VMEVWSTTLEPGENESFSICCNSSPSFFMLKQELKFNYCLDPSFSFLSSNSSYNCLSLSFFELELKLLLRWSPSSSLNLTYNCLSLSLFELELKLLLPWSLSSNSSSYYLSLFFSLSSRLNPLLLPFFLSSSSSSNCCYPGRFFSSSNSNCLFFLKFKFELLIPWSLSPRV
jgi:hypothetical protein